MEFLAICIIAILMCITGYTGISSFKTGNMEISEKEMAIEVQNQGNPTSEQ